MARRAEIEDIDGETGPIRQCALTRTRLPIDGLIRFVLAPDGNVVPDIRHRLPGRGVWVSASAKAVEQATKRKLWAKAFKRAVVASAGLAAELDGLIASDCLQSLSFANKAGLVVAGFAKVEAALRQTRPAARIVASNAGREGREKLDKVVFSRFGSISDLGVIDLFDTTQLSLALGRENVIHAVALAGAASEAFVKRCRTLTTYRIAEPENGARSGVVASGHMALADRDILQEPIENE